MQRPLKFRVYIKETDVWTDGYRVWHPTHWMHLPEPPEN